MGQRYNVIEGKNAREIVLLRSFPCKYGKCSFCNYILDNSLDEKAMVAFNSEILANVDGRYGALEVINSGSVFEIPDSTIEEIIDIAKKKNIKIIYFEIYYSYFKLIEKLRARFEGFELRIRMGLETFDNDFRRNVYNKRFSIEESEYERIAKEIYSVCLLNCVEGQTREMISRDIEMALKYFRSCTINMFVDNGTAVHRDAELASWFVKEYGYLQDDPRVEMLIDNKDLGVFEQ